MGLTLTISYPFIKHIPIAASHFIVAPGYAGQNNGMPHYHFVHGLPSSMERESAVMKCRVAPGTAKTGNRDNDTPVQSQSERDKTVAGNEGGSGRPSVGVKLPWCQFAADRLATSLRETHLHLGVSRTNRDASIIKPNTRRSIETENCLCFPDLKNFLVFG